MPRMWPRRDERSPSTSPSVVVRRDDLDLVERLEQHRLALRRHRLERQNARHLERHLVRVHRVIRAVEQLDAGSRRAESRRARRAPPPPEFPSSTAGMNLPRNRAADDLVVELDSRRRAAAARMRTQQSPNWPRPPDCFLWRPCPSRFALESFRDRRSSASTARPSRRTFA